MFFSAKRRLADLGKLMSGSGISFLSMLTNRTFSATSRPCFCRESAGRIQIHPRTFWTAIRWLGGGGQDGLVRNAAGLIREFVFTLVGCSPMYLDISEYRGEGTIVGLKQPIN